jgi:uncharacterized caspase-like protein
LKYIKLICSKVLAHPAWTGVGSIVAIASFALAFVTVTPPMTTKRTLIVDNNVVAKHKIRTDSTFSKENIFINQRVALVIGNAHYNHVPQLQNAENDANAIVELLKSKGFKVIKHIDADRKTIIKSVRNFQTLLALGGVGLFYYAGHAVNIAGEDFLIPIDTTEIISAYEVPDVAVNLSALLMPVDKIIENQPKSNGAVVVYAAGKGQLALDGEGEHSPFAEQLIEDINQDEYEIFDLFRSLTKGVSKKTAGKQVPWVSASVDTEFYFNKPDKNIGILKLMFFDACRNNPFKR